MALLGAALAAMSALAQDQAPLAIRGYDAVAYFTRGAATRGLAELEYEWDERRYRFATAGHRDLFKADPGRYAPQFANMCAMALTRGERVAANPEYWLISEGKLYIFGDASGPARFKRDVEANAARAEKNWRAVGAR